MAAVAAYLASPRARAATVAQRIAEKRQATLQSLAAAAALTKRWRIVR
jgi:hypothetical protein